jgi:hypothetical protein
MPHQHTHDHAHANAHVHAPGERHPHAEVSPSLLRFSALERIGIALMLTAILWAAVFWAIGWKA